MVRNLISLVVCLLLTGCRDRSDDPADMAPEALHKEFEDWPKAKRKYVGQFITIRGTVMTITDSWLAPYDWKSVAMGQPTAGVICHFPSKSLTPPNDLSPKQIVRIRGRCIGEFDGIPILSECRVVR